MMGNKIQPISKPVNGQLPFRMCVEVKCFAFGKVYVEKKKVFLLGKIDGSESVIL